MLHQHLGGPRRRRSSPCTWRASPSRARSPGGRPRSARGARPARSRCAPAPPRGCAPARRAPSRASSLLETHLLKSNHQKIKRATAPAMLMAHPLWGLEHREQLAGTGTHRCRSWLLTDEGARRERHAGCNAAVSGSTHMRGRGGIPRGRAPIRRWAAPPAGATWRRGAKLTRWTSGTSSGRRAGQLGAADRAADHGIRAVAEEQPGGLPRDLQAGGLARRARAWTDREDDRAARRRWRTSVPGLINR